MAVRSPAMEFRRITNLPPYVFTIINNLKVEARRAGVDVIDLGFGNPDIPSPAIAVEKLAEAAHISRNHRYSMSRGLPKLREAVAALYQRRWGVELDAELEITNTIGSKEGFSHLMWVLLQSGDAAIVPSPSYPIHIYGPLFAGADLRQVPMRSLSDARVQQDHAGDFFANLETAWEVGWPKPRVLVISFPHNPTGSCVDAEFMQRVVDFCREREMVVVHDFAYADIGFDGYDPPSILQADGAKECAVELYSMTKSFSMAGWRCAYMVGNAEVVQALVKLKSYLDYGSVPAHPDRGDGHDERGAGLPEGGLRHLPGPAGHPARRPDAARVGHPQAEGDDVRLGSDPRAVLRAGLRRVLLDGRAGLRGGAVAGGGVRARRRGVRALRPHRERAAHRPGPPQPPPGPGQALAALVSRQAAHRGFTDWKRRRHVRRGRARYRRPVPRYVLRLWLPDRPGALGQVASRIGSVHADVVGIEILERGGGRAVDDLVVALPSDDLVDLLVREVTQVEGVDVEWIQAVEGADHDPQLALLEAASGLAEVEDESARLHLLGVELQRVFELTWISIVDRAGSTVVFAAGAAPPASWVLAFVEGSRHLVDQADQGAEDVAWTELGDDRYLAVGRTGRPLRARERRQLAALVRINTAIDGAYRPGWRPAPA